MVSNTMRLLIDLRCYVILCDSSDKDDKLVDVVMNQGSVDVWHVHSDGAVDMMMDRSMYGVVHRYLPMACALVSKNMEVYVQAAEGRMLTQKQKERNRYHEVGFYAYDFY